MCILVQSVVFASLDETAEQACGQATAMIFRMSPGAWLKPHYGAPQRRAGHLGVDATSLEQRPRARTALARYLHVLSAAEDESAEEKVDPLEALCVTAGEEAVPHLVIVERANAQKAHDGVDVPDAVEYRRPGEAPARLRFEGTHGCEFLYAAIADHMRLVEDEASPLHPECPDRTRTVIPSVVAH